jgi:diguanylate cyclase (GGDEF)-like protein
MPLVARGYAWGMLDLYRAGACSWSEHDLALARLYVDIAASYIALADERDREQKARRELEHRVTHDELTGLPNRGLLFDRLEHAVLAASRHLRTVAVLFVDIDDFKEINDALGHAFGDTVLVEVSRRLGLTLRANDTLARLAGDEFVVICEDLTGSPIQIDRWLHALGRRIQLTLRQPPIVWQTEIMLSVSIGAAVTTQGRGARELISDADRAMYVAKQRGGGRLVISKRNDGSSTRRRADRDLARAQEPRPESRS